MTNRWNIHIITYLCTVSHALMIYRLEYYNTFTKFTFQNNLSYKYIFVYSKSFTNDPSG